MPMPVNSFWPMNLCVAKTIAVFCFLLRLLGDAVGAVAVQGGLGATQEGKVRLVEQVEQPVGRFMEKAVFALGLCGGCPARGRWRCTRGGGPGCRSPAGFCR